jgi:hypothetical protein
MSVKCAIGAEFAGGGAGFCSASTANNGAHSRIAALNVQSKRHHTLEERAEFMALLACYGSNQSRVKKPRFKIAAPNVVVFC